MKRLLAIAMFIFIAAVPGWANPIMWEGTFTYKIYELYTYESGGAIVPGVPGLDVGYTFGGYYSYVSPIVNGTFGLPESPIREFSISVPTPLAYEPDPPGTQKTYQWFDSMVPGPLITVLDGSVTDFYFQPEVGPVGFNFNLTTFSIINSGYDDWYKAQGTVQFDSPTSAVPEPATIMLLGVGLIGLAGFRWRRLHGATDIIGFLQFEAFFSPFFEPSW